MLGLMVPGVGMGASETGIVPPSSGGRFMLMLGAGRIFVPFAIGAEMLRRLMGSEIMAKFFDVTHLSNLG